MNAIDDLLPPANPLDDGGELLTQLVAAVDFLRRGASPGLTVWDAMEQALRIFGNFEADWLDPDPLMRAIRFSTSIVGHLTTAEVITAAVREWLSAMSSIYNEGIPWEVVHCRSETGNGATVTPTVGLFSQRTIREPLTNRRWE